MVLLTYYISYETYSISSFTFSSEYSISEEYIRDISTPTLIRYGELTNDEFFVTEDAAKKGVTITNTSATEPLVMLKHFSENPDLPANL